MGTNWADAVGGLDLGTMRKMLDDVQRTFVGATSAQDGATFLAKARQFMTVLEQGAGRKLDVAARSGFQPVRYVGIDSLPQFPLSIGVGAVVGLNVNAALKCKIIGFRWDATWAVDFVINQIQISTLGLILGPVGVPATAFVTGVSLPPTDAPLLTPGSPAVVTVLNRGAAVRNALGMFTVIPLESPGCEG